MGGRTHHGVVDAQTAHESPIALPVVCALDLKLPCSSPRTSSLCEIFASTGDSFGVEMEGTGKLTGMIMVGRG